MKNIISHIWFTAILAAALAGCTAMDDTYKEFLGDDIIYISMADSVKAYPGDERLLIAWNPLKDPRAEKVVITWANGTKSIVKEPEHEKDTSIVIPSLAEGSYSFSLYVLDESGNSSLPVLVSGEAYGEYYKSTLFDRMVRRITKEAQGIAIEFYPSSDEAFIRQDISYLSSATQRIETITVTAEDPTTISIPDYGGEDFTTLSYYNPNDIELDVFTSPETKEYTPTVPLPMLPLDGMSNVSCCPSFEWKPILAGESEQYTVSISKDRISWTDHISGDGTTFIPRQALDPNTTYVWKVTGGSLESPERTFTTGDKDIYGDMEVVKLSGSSKPAASNIVILGEGFIQADCRVGGVYQRRSLEAVEALFKTEPYKSYREYFNVYQVTAYSGVRGIATLAETAFGTSLDTETMTLTCNRGSVNAYLDGNIDGFQTTDLDNTSVLVIVNADIDAGTTLTYDNGQTISLCPLYSNYESMPYRDFRYVAIRHAGGFGYGLLAEESTDLNETITAEKISELQALWLKGRALNLELTPQSGEPEDNVRWKDFIGLAGYDKAGAFEGGYGFSKGVLRSENVSVMTESHIPYFNIASRLAIVKRILSVAGESFDTGSFINKDSSDMDPAI